MTKGELRREAPVVRVACAVRDAIGTRAKSVEDVTLGGRKEFG